MPGGTGVGGGYGPGGEYFGRIPHYVTGSSLPAAGAFSDQAFQAIDKGTLRVTYWVKYTRGAAGGFPTFRHEYSNASPFEIANASAGTYDVAREIILDPTSITAAAPNATIDAFLEQVNGPAPASGSAITFCLTYERLPAACRAVRLLVAEAGVVGTPGTCNIYMTVDSVEA
jgi:hypothetical protein